MRPEEDHDLLNNKHCYYMNEERFDIIILQENEGDENAKNDLKSKIPHLAECFDIFIV